MEPVPTVAPSCSLSGAELREQLSRYRVIGEGAEVVEWFPRLRAVRIAASVSDGLIERVVEVEQACCPFFSLTWDTASRCLMMSVSEVDQEPALDALVHALGIAPLTSGSAQSPDLTARQ